MSSPNQRETVDKRANSDEGHYVRWEISVKDLDVMRTWKFMRKYRTFCKVSNTLWDFKLCFPEVREDGTASMSIDLTRTDSLDGVEMGAAVWVDVTDSNKKPIYPRKIFKKVGIVPKSQVVDTVELVPKQNMGGAVKEKVVVLITLMVSSCHSSKEVSSDDTQ